MLKFKKTEIGDIDVFREYTQKPGEFSCENTFVNMLVWQCAYNNMWAEEDGQLIIKSGRGENSVYRLPFGDDFDKGIELIRRYSGKDYPDFWAQEGTRLDLFRERFGDKYSFDEKRDAFDYIYLQSDLAELSGKKYHGKRNHISAFSRSFKWEFRPLSEVVKEDIRRCAAEWYGQNSQKEDSYMLCEKRGIGLMLDNYENLGIRGGAIYVNGKAVAFTLGSAVNDSVFDTHIEKALPEYAAAYTVINNEFAKTLADFKYINREDDLGLEGLRKAKLSYKPGILLKKYRCTKKVTI